MMWFAALMLLPGLVTAQTDSSFTDADDFYVKDAVAITADLDDMRDRRVIRVLTTYNRTNFFVAGGPLRGFEYELLAEFEKFLNANVSKKEVKTTLVYAPVTKDELIPLLLEGRGDIVAAGLTITPERLASVDFADAYLTDVKEVVVTRKGLEGIRGVDDLAGRTVHMVAGSSYTEHLRAISERLYAFGNEKIDIVEVGRFLETEDILEMVNAGIFDISVADEHLAKLWADAMKDIVVRDDVAINTGGELAWAVRKSNPLLKESSTSSFARADAAPYWAMLFFSATTKARSAGNIRVGGGEWGALRVSRSVFFRIRPVDSNQVATKKRSCPPLDRSGAGEYSCQ